MKMLKKTSVKSFIESVEAANTLSEREIKQHGEWQDRAAEWLFQQGYVVATEVVLPNGKRVDVIGFNEQDRIIIVEVKASYQDFIRDSKWGMYLEHCDEFYFCFNGIGVSWGEEQKAPSKKYQEQTRVGLIIPENRTIKVVAKDQMSHRPINRKEIIYSVSKSLSKKLVYGY